MPFGLTNALATFQALMNEVLHPFLCRFVLVFFDDILIYNNSWTDNLRHVRQSSTSCSSTVFFFRSLKCSFGTQSVSNLGHFISKAGVAMDKKKVQAVQEWPVPKTVRAIREFLGLACYYRKFIQGFGAIVEPLTKLLRKEAFHWTGAATNVFKVL